MKLYKLRNKNYPFKFYSSYSGRNMWTSVGHIKSSFKQKQYKKPKMYDYEIPEEGH